MDNKMFNIIKEFATAEDGAITVDWVVLTAGIVGLGLSVIYLIGSRATDTTDNVGLFISERQIVTTFE